ncbi:MAG: hypothetical protein HP493_07020 [Nitrospira sp.]|nr:hypothetical protein [Nitrospira sp.]
MRAPLFARGIGGGLRLVQNLCRISQGGFCNMQTFGDFSADVIDLHDTEIEFLQFNERRQLVIQCVLSIRLRKDTYVESPSGSLAAWWAH